MELNGDVRAHLYVRGDGTGERVVTAGDVAWPTEVDVINPEQPIATLDRAECRARHGPLGHRGPRLSPGRGQETFALGEIPIDAIFTPIQKVNYVVEHTRVGQMTDFDRLILEILTDGTIEPDDALSQAAQILVEHARSLRRVQPRTADGVGRRPVHLRKKSRTSALAELGLSPRVLNALRSRQIDKVGQVLTMDPDQLLSIRNFGPRSLNELREKLDEYGYLPEGEAGVSAPAMAISTRSNRRWSDDEDDES